jgi:hypothetical protein
MEYAIGNSREEVLSFLREMMKTPIMIVKARNAPYTIRSASFDIINVFR